MTTDRRIQAPVKPLANLLAASRRTPRSLLLHGPPLPHLYLELFT